MTILESIQRGADYLAKKGVESPRLQVELLVAHLLGWPRLKLYLNFTQPLTEAQQAELREWLRRRGRREPLQQITGSTSFCGLEMTVSPKVLTPRPETELLAEMAWTQLLPGMAALDWGTGSGCLAILLAVKCPAAQVAAVDVCPEALAVARANAARHQVESRIQFICGDGLSSLPPDARFDLIVANPPYIPSAEIATLEPEVRNYDPRLALDGGVDGLDFYRRLAGAGNLLRPGGRILLEFGEGQADSIKKLLELQMWIVESIREDYTGRQRILVARRSE